MEEDHPMTSAVCWDSPTCYEIKLWFLFLFSCSPVASVCQACFSPFTGKQNSTCSYLFFIVSRCAAIFRTLLNHWIWQNINIYMRKSLHTALEDIALILCIYFCVTSKFGSHADISHRCTRARTNCSKLSSKPWQVAGAINSDVSITPSSVFE